MTYVKKNRTSAFKWAIALVLFVLGLTVTFSDVYGSPGHPQDEVTVHNRTVDNGVGDIDKERGPGFDDGEDNGDDNPPPAAIPEPGTLILLASGLGAMYVARRRRNKIK